MPRGTEVSENGYRTDIDGLRAIAVTAVVFYHAGAAVFSGGFIGVDVFFVISGYLIGAHIYRDISAGRFSIARFYRKRAQRILPALFFLLLVCYAFALLILTPMELTNFAQYAISTVFSYSNVLAWQNNNYFSPGADQRPLLMTWSLGVEEQFYIFIPLLMLLLARKRKMDSRGAIWLGMWGIALFSFGLSVWGTLTYRHFTFYLLPSRAWELAVGVLMAIYEAEPAAERLKPYGGLRWSNLRSVAGVGAILYAVVHYGPNTLFPGASALPPVLGAALILSAPQAWLNRHVLSSSLFRRVGLVSYSWYLWHWPLLSFARISADMGISVKSGVAICLIALGMAWVSYRFVEQPFRHTKAPAAGLLLRYATASFLIASPAVAMQLLHGIPKRFPAASAQESSLYRTHPCVSFSASIPATEDCLPTPDGREAVALMGDSHADAIAVRMHQLAAADNMRMYMLMHASCPALVGMATSLLDPVARHECVTYSRAALQRVAEDATVHTVVLAGLWAGPVELAARGNGFLREGQEGPVTPEQSFENFREGLDGTVSLLRQAGKRVVILQDDEALRFDADKRLKAYLIPVRRWIRRRVEQEMAVPGRATRDEMYWKENDEAAQIVTQVAAERGAVTFDLRARLCSDSSCAFYMDGAPLYLDTNHLSPPGVTLALRGIPLREGESAPALK